MKAFVPESDISCISWIVFYGAQKTIHELHEATRRIQLGVGVVLQR